VVADDALGAFGQFHGRLVVVGAVTYFLAQDALGFAFVAFRSGDCGPVQSRDLLVLGGPYGQFNLTPSSILYS
jgi:hypothetical protein